jgi:hypothetical protein
MSRAARSDRPLYARNQSAQGPKVRMTLSWRGESRANSSLNSPNSLLTAKKQGISPFWALRGRQGMPNTGADTMSYEESSLRIGTGNFLRVTVN